MSNSYDVYIGNLSVATTREQLRELFSQAGEILLPSLKKLTLIFQMITFLKVKKTLIILKCFRENFTVRP